jgi:hypothetical protein
MFLCVCNWAVGLYIFIVYSVTFSSGITKGVSPWVRIILIFKNAAIFFNDATL